MKNLKIKNLFLASMICFFTFHTFAQSKAETIVKKYRIEFVNNKIKFNIGWASKPEKPGGLIVGIGDRLLLDLTEKQLQKIELLSCDELLVLLKDNKTDWAINLILYYAYDKDAWLFSECCDNTRQKWLRFSKEDNIGFWTEKFSKY